MNKFSSRKYYPKVVVRSFLIVVMLFSTATIKASPKYNLGSGYAFYSLSSDKVDSASISALAVNGNYIIDYQFVKNLNMQAGLSVSFGNMGWIGEGFERIGNLNEISLSIGADYPIQKYIVYSAINIPLYSSLSMGGALNSATNQGYLESASETTYSGSGFELMFGGEYPVGNFKVMDLGFGTNVTLELGYASRTFAVEQTSVVSSFSDFTGSHLYDVAASGVSVKIGVKLRAN